MIGFECGEGMSESTEAWAAAGKAKGCLKGEERHGRWLFWEEGYVNLEGFYRVGVKHGAWTVFSQDGSAFVRLSFEDGKMTGKTYYVIPPGVRV
jgi:antitoxin component YwqK of YwqJK toxin-antitoxin module